MRANPPCAQEMVALTGAHTLGRARRRNFGFSGRLSPQPDTFSNDYFVNLLAPQENVLRMPSDRILAGTPGARPASNSNDNNKPYLRGELIG